MFRHILGWHAPHPSIWIYEVQSKSWSVCHLNISQISVQVTWLNLFTTMEAMMKVHFAINVQWTGGLCGTRDQCSSIYRWCRGIFITDALWSTWNWSNVDFLEELNLKHQSKYKMTHLLGDMIRSKYKMTHFLGDMLTFNPWMALFFLEILWSCFLPWNFIYLSLVILS